MKKCKNIDTLDTQFFIVTSLDIFQWTQKLGPAYCRHLLLCIVIIFSDVITEYYISLFHSVISPSHFNTAIILHPL